MSRRPIARIAVVSLHTSPLDPPGAGDAGGMNVDVRAVAERLSARGVAVDVFTRCSGRGVPEVDHLAPLARVIQIQSGPCGPVPKRGLEPLISEFAEGMARAAPEGGYDLVHAHYWLSAPAAAAAAARWDAPLVVSFHTLAEVKNRVLAAGDIPEPLARVSGEREAVRQADLVVAPTATEAGNLLELYGAEPGRVSVVPPGIDHGRFFPRPRGEARRRLGLDDRPVVLFLGRLQPLKGPDVAIGAFAEARRRTPALERGRLLVVGGPSGAGGQETLDALRVMAEDVAVDFLGPMAHANLPWIYSAADVLVMPSRSESFGLTALEAQACGLPVVAADVGGLRHLVHEGESGLLVPGHDPADHAAALARIVEDRALRTRLARGARANASGYAWDRTADSLLEVYDDLGQDRAAMAAS